MSHLPVLAGEWIALKRDRHQHSLSSVRYASRGAKSAKRPGDPSRFTSDPVACASAAGPQPWVWSWDKGGRGMTAMAREGMPHYKVPGTTYLDPSCPASPNSDKSIGNLSILLARIQPVLQAPEPRADRARASLLIGATADGRREAIQEGRERDRRDMEGARRERDERLDRGRSVRLRGKAGGGVPGGSKNSHCCASWPQIRHSGISASCRAT